ncbi:hypothetical protein BC628DRAFT_1482958 [Trametes gibbosa]|nr:hypothetical protein BC628DRAFT_1482958 [Trametes gibbosa]
MCPLPFSKILRLFDADYTLLRQSTTTTTTDAAADYRPPRPPRQESPASHQTRSSALSPIASPPPPSPSPQHTQDPKSVAFPLQSAATRTRAPPRSKPSSRQGMDPGKTRSKPSAAPKQAVRASGGKRAVRVRLGHRMHASYHKTSSVQSFKYTGAERVGKQHVGGQQAKNAIHGTGRRGEGRRRRRRS